MAITTRSAAAPRDSAPQGDPLRDSGVLDRPPSRSDPPSEGGGVSIPGLHTHVRHLQGPATSTPTGFGGTTRERTRAASGSPPPPAGRDPGRKKVRLDLSSPDAAPDQEAPSSEARGGYPNRVTAPPSAGLASQDPGPHAPAGAPPSSPRGRAPASAAAPPSTAPRRAPGPDGRRPRLLDQAWVQELQRALGILLAPPCHLRPRRRVCRAILRIRQSGRETRVTIRTPASPLTKF